jgi:hypothetical protein
MVQGGGRRAGLAMAIGIAVVAVGAPARAETARDILIQASFVDTDEASALKRVSNAYAAAVAALRRAPEDHEALLMRATALGYRAKLTGNRTDAVSARRQLEALTTQNPRDAEAQLALGAWHVGAVKKLGMFVGRAAVGAQRGVGLAALDKAVALGGDRALYPGLAALLRLELEPGDPRGRTLAEQATRAATPTALDRILQRGAGQVLVPLRTGDMRTVRRLSSQLLPFGRFDDD